MSRLTVAIGCDHAGYLLREALCPEIEAAGFEVLDFGTRGPEPVDYPDFGYQVARAVVSGAAWRGIIICGSGIGISIAANRYPKARAALCTNSLMARLSRSHNDANIMALAARLTGIDMAKECLKEFLTTNFLGERHQRRVDKLGEPQGSSGL